MNTLILVIIAGIMNGSFVTPIRSIRGMTSEKIWFHYSWIALVVLPILAALLLTPSSLQIYFLLPPRDFFYLLLGGCLFGIGQICLAYAIDRLGIAQSFVINLSMGLILGSLGAVYQLEQTSLFFSKKGMILATAFIMVFISLASNYQIEKTKKFQKSQNYLTGWLLAILAGIASALQNITFTLVTTDGQNLFSEKSTFWAWPPFLVTAAIPMLIGFWHRSQKVLPVSITGKHSPTRVFSNGFYILCMGILFTGSLVLYSQALSQLLPYQKFAGWPTFMVSIIITAQIWDWKETKVAHIQTQEIIKRLANLALLILAVFLVALET